MKDLAPLLDAVADAYARHGRTARPGAAMARKLAELVGRLDAADARPKAGPARFPAADLVPAALDEAERGPAAAIAAALRPVLPTVEWIRTYSEAELGAAYMRGYAYFDIAGPGHGLIHTDTLALGVLVIGPGLLYPAHNHPAVELYHVVAGTPGWQVDDAPWEDKPAGSFVFHPTMAVHAMRTGAATLVALYAWLGDLATPAKLLPRT